MRAILSPILIFLSLTFLPSQDQARAEEMEKTGSKRGALIRTTEAKEGTSM